MIVCTEEEPVRCSTSTVQELMEFMIDATDFDENGALSLAQQLLASNGSRFVKGVDKSLKEMLQDDGFHAWTVNDEPVVIRSVIS